MRTLVGECCGAGTWSFSMTSKSPVLLMPMAEIVEGRDMLVVVVIAKVLVKLERSVLVNRTRLQWRGLKSRTLRLPHDRA